MAVLKLHHRFSHKHIGSVTHLAKVELYLLIAYGVSALSIRVPFRHIITTRPGIFTFGVRFVGIMVLPFLAHFSYNLTAAAGAEIALPCG